MGLGEKTASRNGTRPSPDFSPRLRDKIWEWPGDEATNGEHRAEANDCQLGCELSFICNHAIIISVRHLRASFEWLYSISLSVPEDSPSATPRLNHSAVRVETLSRAPFKEHCSEGL